MNQSGFTTVNPAIDEAMETFRFFTKEETESKLSLAEKTFPSFRALSVYQRSQLLVQLAASLRKNYDTLARTITTEMGKITAEALTEVEKLLLRLSGTPSMDLNIRESDSGNWACAVS